MTAPIPVNLVVEDALTEAVLRTILEQTGRPYAIGTCYGLTGYDYIRRTIGGFNNAAQSTPFIVITDLDQTECPPALINSWLPGAKHPNLIFRVAVREVESWVLAHRAAFSAFLGISASGIPQDCDSINDPKQFLIALARSSARSALKRDIIPPGGSTRKQGPGYNGRLIQFVRDEWDVEIARASSDSLNRTTEILETFVPTWVQ